MAGNVAFMFLCTIMVLGMTPGLGMFYGGMVRRKNALNTMMFHKRLGHDGTDRASSVIPTAVRFEQI